MATITPVQLPSLPWFTEQGGVIVQWQNVGNTDTCAPIELGTHTDRSVQITGTFDGGSVAIQGSNEASLPYAPLTDPQGNDIAISSYPSGYTSKIEAVSEATRYLKPAVSGGTAPSLTITLFARR